MFLCTKLLQNSGHITHINTKVFKITTEINLHKNHSNKLNLINILYLWTISERNWDKTIMTQIVKYVSNQTMRINLSWLQTYKLHCQEAENFPLLEFIQDSLKLRHMCFFISPNVDPPETRIEPFWLYDVKAGKKKFQPSNF